MKSYVMGTHLKHLTEVVLMSTHNMFHGEISRIFTWIFLLSRGMDQVDFCYMIFGYPYFNESNSVGSDMPQQTVYTQIGCSRMWHLIRVYTIDHPSSSFRHNNR